MKKLTTLVLLACIASMGMAQKPKKAEKKKETVTIQLDEMCGNCVSKINTYIAFEKGVTALDINPDEMSVDITYWNNKTDTTKLKNAFTKVKMNVEAMKMVEQVEK